MNMQKALREYFTAFWQNTPLEDVSDASRAAEAIKYAARDAAKALAMKGEPIDYASRSFYKQFPEMRVLRRHIRRML
jgi:hypothetical protein